jgi:hypothetical protein
MVILSGLLPRPVDLDDEAIIADGQASQPGARISMVLARF